MGGISSISDSGGISSISDLSGISSISDSGGILPTQHQLIELRGIYNIIDRYKRFFSDLTTMAMIPLALEIKLQWISTDSALV